MFLGFVTYYVDVVDGVWDVVDYETEYCASCFVFIFWIVWIGKPHRIATETE